jgi:hypothetical protein
LLVREEKGIGDRTTTTTTTTTMGDTSHVVPLPRWVFFIRIAQAVLALLIIALVAFSTYVYNYTYVCVYTG